MFLKKTFVVDKKMDKDATVLIDPRKGYEQRSKLSKLADGLKLDDKISIVFLLFNNVASALDSINHILQSTDKSTQNNLFYKWIFQESNLFKSDWKDTLVEALTIIQNYKLAKIFGRSKEKLISKYMPKNNLKSFNVLEIRKVLYNLCESISEEECSQLSSVVEFEDLPPFKNLDNCFEYCLMLWNAQGIININYEEEVDVSVLIKCLRSLGLSNFINDIEIVVEKSNCYNVRNKLVNKQNVNLSNFYQVIDENNIGMCVIINEKNFSKFMFPKRWGTDKDVQRLIEVFTAFGFNIYLHSDLTHEQLINTLGYYASAVDETVSFFVLIILSHGSENVMYTSDSLPIDMNTIEMMFQAEVCPNLIGKPKIFIIQSCQGEKWQKVLIKNDDEPEVEADNFVFSKSEQPLMMGPQRGDSLIAWSTVQGFASFRDKYNGSWYIQELCRELWKYGDTLDLVEIFTRVNNNLRSKVYDGQFMVPSLLLSLRAKVKFPIIEDNWLKGKKMMFERLIFEKLFREFVTENKSFEFGIEMKFS